MQHSAPDIAAGAVDTRIDKMKRSPSGSSSQDTNNLSCECFNRGVHGGDPEKESCWKLRSLMPVLRCPQTTCLNPLHILFHFHGLGNLMRYWWLRFMKTDKGKYLTSCSKQSVREFMDWCCLHFRHILLPQVTHQKIPHRHAWRLVSWVILDPVKLTILTMTFIPILDLPPRQGFGWTFTIIPILCLSPRQGCGWVLGSPPRNKENLQEWEMVRKLIRKMKWRRQQRRA